MDHVDTSLIVAALTREARTGDVQQWLSRHEPGQVCISPWVTTEFASALALKLRTKQIHMQAQKVAASLFAALVTDSFVELPVMRHHFSTAATLVAQSGSGLRAGDALHLAIVLERGAVLYTLDKRMADAGHGLGVAVRLL